MWCVISLLACVLAKRLRNSSKDIGKHGVSKTARMGIASGLAARTSNPQAKLDDKCKRVKHSSLRIDNADHHKRSFASDLLRFVRLWGCCVSIVCLGRKSPKGHVKYKTDILR